MICGFDDKSGKLYGRGAYEGIKEYASTDQAHPLKSEEGIPMMGAILIGDKTGTFDAREAELSALMEAVTHAHGATGKCGGRYDHLASGLECYDAWIAGHRFFEPPGMLGHLGITLNSHMLDTIGSGRASASQFMLELAPKYPVASAHFEMAAEHFALESAALKSSVRLLNAIRMRCLQLF